MTSKLLSKMSPLDFYYSYQAHMKPTLSRNLTSNDLHMILKMFTLNYCYMTPDDNQMIFETVATLCLLFYVKSTMSSNFTSNDLHFILKIVTQ